MNKVFIEALYNENRNAIPSWQGYHYQAQAATYFFVKYILECYKNNKKNMTDIEMRIEWMEDFIIFDKDNPLYIYQVKKTLNNSDYDDVMKNFIFQHKIIDDSSCKWILVYDEKSNETINQITEHTYKEKYSQYIEKVLLKEINLLIENRENSQFWIDNLKLRNTNSNYTPLLSTNIRGYIRKLMETEGLKREKLDVEQCGAFTTKYIEALKNKLIFNEGDYLKFSTHLDFSNLEINKLEKDTETLIRELVDGSFVVKNDVITESEIVDSIYSLIYEKLMKIRKKRETLLNISFEDIKHIIEGREKALLLWKRQLFLARESMISNIKIYCDECIKKECTSCVVTEFCNLDFYKVIDNCNLEYPRFRPENISMDLRNKLGEEKYNHIIEILFNYKDQKTVLCSREKNNIELYQGDKKMFVSEYISDNKIGRSKLIDNIPEHLEIYMEYDSIITKLYTGIIDYEDIKIIKDKTKGDGGEKRAPKFNDILPIDFRSKECLKNDARDD